MKKVVIIGASDFQNPLILKAKQLNYETHVFAWKDGSIGEETADYFYPISIIEKEQILEKCKQIKPDAVISIASDLASVTVNYLAKELNLYGNSMECTEKSTNKYLMRKTFLQSDLPSPKFEIADENFDTKSCDSMQYPLIVKPTDRSGSRAIYKIEDPKDLEKAIKEAVSTSFEKKAIVEEFIEGQEYSMEGITYNGKHEFLAITKKQTTGAPHFIETGHVEPSGIDEQKQIEIKQIMAKALDALNVQNSATHSEFKITQTGEIRIIEIGARMGGDCIGSDMVQISTGYDYLKMTLDVALGQKPEFKKISDPKIAIVKFIFTKKDIETFEKVKSECPENIYYVSKFDEINSHEIIDSGTRYGYYILACENKDKIGWLINE